MASIDDPPKLPVRQLLILSVARLSEPLAMTSVFPYLPEMIENFGIPRDNVGRWVGTTSGIFAMAQCVSGLPWGRASDRWGRKRMMIISLTTTMIGFILWGLSTSLAMAITVRAFLGLSNGNAGILRTVVAELVPWKELQPTAFALLPMIWSVGSIFGPSLGGYFANPARKFPDTFGRIQFFRDFPYALPSFLAAAIFLLSLSSAIFFLEETLETKRNRPDWGLMVGQKITRAFSRGRKAAAHRRASDAGVEAAAAHEPLMGSNTTKSSRSGPSKPAPAPAQAHRFMDVFTVQTVNWLVAYFVLATHSISFDGILPVLFHAPVENHTPDNTQLPFRFGGGFGMSADQIGTIFTLYGIASGFGQFFFFPPLCRAAGTLNCARICSILFPLIYLVTPYVVLIPNPDVRWSAALSVMAAKGFASAMAFPCVTMLFTNSASSMTLLGTLNGIAVVGSGFGRAVGPTVTGLLFTAGTKSGYAVAPWFGLVGIAALGTIPPFLMGEPGGLQKSRDDAAAAAAAAAAVAAAAEEEDDDDAANSGIISVQADTPAESENATLLDRDEDNRPKTYGTV